MDMEDMERTHGGGTTKGNVNAVKGEEEGEPEEDGEAEENVTRIGRTGRAGAAGAADTLFTPQDARHAAELVRVLREAKQHVPAELVQLGQAARGPKKTAQDHEPSPWGIPTLG